MYAGVGLLIVAISEATGWYWAVVLVVLLSIAASHWGRGRFNAVHRWLTAHPEPEEPLLLGQLGRLVAIFARLRRSLLARLARSNRLLARIRVTASELPVAVVVLSHNGRIEWANRRAGELLGVHWPQDANLPLQHLCRDVRLRRLLEQGQKESVLELHSPALAEGWVQLRILHHKNMTLVIGSDITEALRIRRMRKDFVANASHELRTPLTVIASIAETLEEQKEKGPPQWHRSIELLQRKVLAMSRLVEDMLSLSSLEDTSRGLRFDVVVDVARLCDQVVQDFSGQIHEAGIKLDRGGGVPFNKNIMGSKTELYSALSNLVKNAIAYSEPGAKITLSWRQSDEGGCLQVADSGIGIEAHHLPHLTERFYKVDDQRNREGTGLGLSIVRNVLQRHQATLEIDSTPGKGSVFSCHFPKHRLA